MSDLIENAIQQIGKPENTDQLQTPSGKSAQISDNAINATDLAQNGLQLVRFRLVRFYRQLQQLRIATDNGQWVVDFMGHTGCQQTDPGQSFGLGQILLSFQQLLAGFFQLSGAFQNLFLQDPVEILVFQFPSARDFVGNEPFAVLLGDDIIDSQRPCLGQLLEVFDKRKGSVLALEKVPMENISSYGCVEANLLEGNTFQVTNMVEKPAREDAPSDMAIIGRYILTPRIFEILEKQEPGKGGEIQLTDAILTLSKEEKVYGCLFEGLRHDCGDKLGFLKATVDMALKREEFRSEFETYLRQRLTAI